MEMAVLGGLFPGRVDRSGSNRTPASKGADRIDDYQVRGPDCRWEYECPGAVVRRDCANDMVI